jgi:predicted permease
VIAHGTWQDLRHAARSLRCTPGLTTAAVVTLALGIGANTAIFSVIDAVLLKTLPVASPEELYFLAHGTGDNPGLSSTYPLFERYRALEDVFSGVTAYTVQEFKVATPTGPQLAVGQYVAAKYHDVLGVRFVLGRGFSNTSDRASGDGMAAIVSEEYWTRAFGRDPGVIGKPLVVQGRSVPVVGVTAAGFHGLRPGTRFEITLPLAMLALNEPEFLGAHDTWTGLNIVARSRPGVTEAQAHARVDAALHEYLSLPEQAWVRRNGRVPDGLRLARLLPAGRGTPGLRRQYDRVLTALMGLVGLFLLIACANVANLMLVRTSARAKEVAIRSSLGATRARLVRQFLTESLLLAAAGGAAGLLLSPCVTTAIVTLFRVGYFPVVLDTEPDLRIVAFTCAVSTFTGLAFGVVAAARGTRIQVAPVLNANSAFTTAGPARLAAGRALAVCQIAICVLLLAATGLLVRSLHNLRTVEAGFNASNVLLFYLDTRGTDSNLLDLYGGLLERFEALPGVRAVSFSTASPLSNDREERGLLVPGKALPDGLTSAVTNRVTTGYFDTLAITILRGRGFTPQDTNRSPRVAVVTEAFARAFFGNDDPIGRTLAFRSMPDALVTVVGVVRDTRHQALRDPAPRMIYLPLAQADEPPSLLTAAIATRQAPRTLEAALRENTSRHSSDLVVSYVRTMEEQIDASLVRERVLAALSSGFGLLALVLACVGLYGVVSHGISRRTREIGIRLALGAPRSMVVWHVLRETLAVCAAGVAIGLAAALAGTRLISAFLFGLSARDPFTLAAVIIVLVGTALVAGYLPARGAARIDPAAAIRAE